MAILDVKELKKSYKKGFIPKAHEVLKGVTFQIKANSITGFLGGNGAGKTTTLKCVLGLAFPTSGQISFFDGSSRSDKILDRIGFLPERPYFYEHLTGVEFLTFYGSLSNRMKPGTLKSRIDELLKRVDLLHAKDRKLKEYSKGMLQKIGLAQALIHDPELLILDEPMSGLDPDGRFYLSELIRETAKEGRSVFFSSHLLNDAETLCERLVVLTNGIVSYEGSTNDYLAKMGDARIVHFLKNGTKQSLRFETAEEMQNKLIELIQSGAKIESIKIDRNLEQAFIKMGLRNDQANTNSR